MAQVPESPASTPLAHPHPAPSRPPNLDASDDLLLSNANLVAENERLEGELSDLYTRLHDMINANAANDRQHEDALRHLAIAAQQDTLRHQQEVTDLTRCREDESIAQQDKFVQEMLELMQELNSVKTQTGEADAEHRRSIIHLESRLEFKTASEAMLSNQLQVAKESLQREHAVNNGLVEKNLEAVRIIKARDEELRVGNARLAEVSQMEIELGLLEAQLETLRNQPASQVEGSQFVGISNPQVGVATRQPEQGDANVAAGWNRGKGRM